MKKILRIAEREFLATAGTRAFIFAVLITPALIAALLVLTPRLLRQGPPKVDGEVAVIDPSGQVTAGLQAFLQPGRIAERRQEVLRRMSESLPQALREVGGNAGANAEANRTKETTLG